VGVLGVAGVASSAGCLTGALGEGETTAEDGEEGTLPPTSAGASTDADGTATTASDETATDGTVASADVDFEASVEAVEKCSKTCRTLTYALQNRGADPAPDVTVRIQVFTDGEEIWDKDQSVGTLDARSQRSGITRDIDVGLLGGQKIKSNDGEVVIELTPQAAGVSETFTFERTLDV